MGEPELESLPATGPTKYCSRCRTDKLLTAFNKDSKSKDGLQGYCRECISAYQKRYHLENKEKRKRYHATRRRKVARKIASEKFREAHPDAQRTYRAAMRAEALGIEGRYTEAEWIELQEYYEYHCLGCLKQLPGELEADHVIPLKQGGPNLITNIQPLCVSCNRQKGTRVVDYRPRWEREAAGISMSHSLSTVVAILDYNRAVEDSHRWTSQEYGQSLSVRIPVGMMDEPHARVRVTVEPYTIEDEEEGEDADVEASSDVN